MAQNHFSDLDCTFPHHIRLALLPLLTGVEYADQSESDRWEFAVEIEQLTALNLAPNDFRWLVRNGLVEHRREVTLECDDSRAFAPSGDLTFPNRTCFVLTDPGLQLARALLASSPSRVHVASPRLIDGDASSYNGNGQTENPLPQWDSERRVLNFNGAVVKCFKWVATNQQAILCAFEEEGWPPRIDDPLPPHPEQDAKRRLSDTIKCLNRKQSHRLVHFRGDGTGEGVLWELVEAIDSQKS